MNIDFLRSHEITENVRRMLAFVRTFDVISLARKPQFAKVSIEDALLRMEAPQGINIVTQRQQLSAGWDLTGNRKA